MKRILKFGVPISSLIVLVLFTFEFRQAYSDSKDLFVGILFWFSWGLATVVLLWLFVLLALRLHASPISPKVVGALKNALRWDKDPGVRSKAAVGLAELDMEESSHYYDHDELDDALTSALQRDPDPLVRSKLAESLTEMELEPFTHHKHDQLEDASVEDIARTFK